VQAHHWRLAGKFFDRHYIEAHRALFHLPLHQKPPRRAVNQMLFLRPPTHPGQRRLTLARRPRPHLYKHQRFPILADQVDLALYFARHIIPRYKNLSKPSQIPIREPLSTYSALPRISFHVT
jgi:hypothetical protein